MSDDQKMYTSKRTVRASSFEVSIEDTSNEPPSTCCCGKGGGIPMEEKLRALLMGFMSQYAAFNSQSMNSDPDFDPTKPPA